jgi:hypothetical protein
MPSGGQPPDFDPPDDTLAQQVDERKTNADRAAAAVPRIGQDDEARRWIAKTIMGIFAGSILLVLMILIVQGILTSHWDTVASQSTDLIKSAVLPIVTLVLGYYFGRGDKD